MLAYPLILAHLSFTLQTFVDRLFLTWYSPEAVAGAVTGLFAVWSIIALFTGTGEYLTTFVAQYLGSGRPQRIGPAMWQGIYFSIGAGLLVAALSPLAAPTFDLAGHDSALRGYEVAYARALLLGAFPVILMATLSAFFAGRGQTQAILRVNVLATLVNIACDWLLIFGHAGFPEMGVTGAALATVFSQVVGAAVYLALILRPEFRKAYRTGAGWRPEPWLVARLVRFGMPTGLQYSLEVGAFAVFMVIVGRIGTLELAASGIAFNLNMIVFMPMVGLAIAVSSLVGRYLGAGEPDVAQRVVASALAMSLAYMAACGLLYVRAPALRRAVLHLRHDQPDPRRGASRRRRHRLSHAAHLRPRLDRDARARLGGLRGPRSGGVLRLDGGEPLRPPAGPAHAPPLPRRALEEHAGDRACPAGPGDGSGPPVRS